MNGWPSDAEIRGILTAAAGALRAMGVAATEVDDIAQIVAEKLLRRWDEPALMAVRLKGGSQWRAYVATVARNSFLDRIRTNDRRVAREYRSAGQARPSNEVRRPSVNRPPESTPSDVERYVSRLCLVALITESGLTLQQEQVLALHFIDGLDTREIAERLQTSRQVVNKQRRQGLRRLYAHLSRPPGPDTHWER